MAKAVAAAGPAEKPALQRAVEAAEAGLKARDVADAAWTRAADLILRSLPEAAVRVGAILALDVPVPAERPGDAGRREVAWLHGLNGGKGYVALLTGAGAVAIYRVLKFLPPPADPAAPAEGEGNHYAVVDRWATDIAIG